jgi:hypothetical protein
MIIAPELDRYAEEHGGKYRMLLLVFIIRSLHVLICVLGRPNRFVGNIRSVTDLDVRVAVGLWWAVLFEDKCGGVTTCILCRQLWASCLPSPGAFSHGGGLMQEDLI